MKNKVQVLFNKPIRFKKKLVTLGIMGMLLATQTIKTHAVVGDISQKVVNSTITEIDGAIVFLSIGLAVVAGGLLFFQQKKLAQQIFVCGLIGIVIFKFSTPIGNWLSSLG